MYRAAELFGGKMRVDVPQSMDDISHFRPVPDNQEIFADASSDCSVIIEALEHVGEINQSNHPVPAAFFLNDLAHVHSADQSSSLEHAEMLNQLEDSLPSLGLPSPSASIACGLQHIAKHGEDATNRVRLCVGNIRLPDFETDLLITVNQPVHMSPSSSSASATASSCCLPYNYAYSVLLKAFQSLTVVDSSLFGSGAADETGA
jgi:hypothetical protein